MRWWAIITILLVLAGAWRQPLQAQPPLVLINEVMHNPSAGPEWVELYNPGPLPVDLSGWRIDDATIGGPHTLIAEGTVIPPGGLLVVPLTSAILNNGDPDQAQLSDQTGRIVDQSPLTVVPRDQTIARQPDGEANWQIGAPSPGAWNSGEPPAPAATVTNPPPSPSPVEEGSPSPSPAPPEEGSDETATSTATATATATATSAATATATATATSTATATATATATSTALATSTATMTATSTATPVAAFDQVIINEIAAAGEHEWVEVYNRGASAVDLSGWVLERVSVSGSMVRRALPAVMIQPGVYVVIEVAKGSLPDGGARLTLFWGQTAMSAPVEYPALMAATVYARLGDGAATWAISTEPTPGEPNVIPEPTATATSTPTAPATSTATATVMATTAALATATPTPTATATLVAAFDQVIINEIAAAGEHEWVELYNRGTTPVNLTDWMLERVSGSVVRRNLPSVTLLPGAYVVVEVAKGSLPDGGARLTLFWGQMAMSVPIEYPALTAATVYARLGDGAATWAISAEPTPGEPNPIPEPAALVTPTATRTPTETRTSTATRTPTETRMPTATRTPTAIRAPTETRTPTATRTPTVTRTPTATKMPTATRAPTATKTPTVTKTPTALPGALPTPWPVGSIVISALLPAPVNGENEWVEVTSRSSLPINLRDWFLSDASGQRRSLAEQELAPGATVRTLMTRALLNNDGDTVMLHDLSGTVIDTFTYTAAAVGQIIWRRSDASQPSSEQTGSDTLALAVTATDSALTPVMLRPTAAPRPASLLPRSPAAAYLSATLPLPTPTRSSTAEADCADCAQPAWPWSRMAAAALGVIALLLFVAEPTPVKAAQRDQDML